MSTPRAPDPTLTALSPKMVQVDLYRPLSVAHQDSDGWMTPCGLGLDPEYVEADNPRLIFMGAGDAAYIAVPCRECFPAAPAPGYDWLTYEVPQETVQRRAKYLAWQVRS